MPQAQFDNPLLRWREGALQQAGRLGAALGWIDRRRLSTDHIAVKAILLKRRGIGLAIEMLMVGLVVGEQPAAPIPAEQLVNP